MRHISRYEALLFAAVGPIGFVFLAAFFDVLVLANVFNSLAAGVFCVIAWRWWGPMTEELRQRGRQSTSGAWVIVLGVFVLAFTLAWQRIYALVVLVLERPAWLTESFMTAFVPFSLMWGGFLFLMAPDMVDRVTGTSHRSLGYLVLAVFIGGAVAGYVGARATF